MKKKILISLSILTTSAMLLTGCQFGARSFGGTHTIELPKNEKLELITWKDDELWYLTRPMREGEKAETWIYQESTDFGVVEGKVIIKERK